MISRLLAAACLVAFQFLAFADDNLVRNGSFEEPLARDLGGSVLQHTGSTLKQIHWGSWRIGTTPPWDNNWNLDECLEMKSDSEGTAAEGEIFVEMNYECNGREDNAGMYQYISTCPGGLYRASFRIRAEGEHDSRLEFWWNGRRQDAWTVNEKKWRTKTFSNLRADYTSTRIEFREVGPRDDQAMHIDDVEVYEQSDGKCPGLTDGVVSQGE